MTTPFLRAFVIPLLASAALLGTTAESAAKQKPNVVWIIVDDMSANFGCYGETTIATPNVDALAKAGTRFSKAFVTAPVCSACRSGLITGCYQTTIGAHHHRSGRGAIKIHLPAGVTPAPVLFQQAGYYTCISSWPANKGAAGGKTDYNFQWDPKMYDGVDWSGRKPGQPFFAQIQLAGGKNRDGGGLRPAVKAALGTLTDPARVKLPPYYPDDPVIRQDWAAYLDAVRFTDLQVGQILAALDGENLSASTIVVFMTDHGISHARGKQFLYDEGTHVPLVFRGPAVEAGKVRGDLVEHLDLTATSLAWAGIDLPKSMQGRNLLASDYVPRDAVFAARDRCDETVDHIRSVRTENFKYIHNYLPDRPHLQPNNYKDQKPTYQRLRELHAEGKLVGLPEELLFSPKRAKEELYQLSADPFETKNLASDPKFADTLADLRKRLADWEVRTGDQGRQGESESMFDSDMAVYLGPNASKNPKNQQILRNIEQMKAWARQGK